MRWIELVVPLLAVGVLVSPSAARQGSAVQVHGLTTIADASSFGVGAGVAVLSRGRVGSGGSITVARYRDAFAVRGELTVSVHLDPGRRNGVSPYAAAGAAVVGTADQMEEYLVVTIGLEAAPRVRRRWFFELGFGGGVRMAVGMRWQPPFLRR